MKFLVEEELNEQKLRAILAPILIASPERRTHKLKFRTSKGILDLVTIPLKEPKKYSNITVTGMLRKIILWDKKSADSLRDHLLSSGMRIRQIIKDGPGTLELKKK